MAIATLNDVPADAHAFRVTLNLLGDSTCCPHELLAPIQKLKKANWNRDVLADPELQLIYGFLTSDLCDMALSEWSVDTKKMRDHGFPYSDANFGSWFTGEGSVDCRLCGHKHNRFEFPLENPNGSTIWTGSTCIQKYGVVVNGEATAERALAMLRKAMGRSKKMQTCQQWQEAHPDHEEVMDLLGDGLNICVRRVPYRMWRALPAGWKGRTHELAKLLRGAVKYHTKNGYLSDQRTCEVWKAVCDDDGSIVAWEEGRLIRASREVIKAFKEAEDRDPIAEAQKVWNAWLTKHDEVLEDWQRRKIQYFRDRGYSREQLYDRNKKMVADVEAAFARKDEPEVEDDYSDIAW